MTGYCRCVHPLLGVNDVTCRRCRREVTPFRRHTEILGQGSVRAELRVETLDDGLTLQGGGRRH